MKILMLSSYLPYPLYSGGHIRLFNLLKELSDKHEITFVCEKRDYQTEEDLLEVKKYCKEIFAVNKKKQWTISNILQTGFSSSPFLSVGHSNKSLKYKLRELLAVNKYDLIHIETFYVAPNLPRNVFGQIPTVLAEHNIEYLVYKRFLKISPAVVKPFLMIDVEKIKYWEKWFWKKVTKLVAVSEEEKMLMNREDVEVVPNGVDIDSFKFIEKDNEKDKRILFIGDFRWIQNRDSISWILKDIWPIVRNEIKAKLWIVGRKIPGSIKETYSASDVIFDENASESTPEIFKKSSVLLAPIRVGGGTSFKILEAMASGVPVVTTNLGIEGIKAIDKREVMVADTSEELVNLVKNLFKNDTLYTNISKNARKLIEEKYNWKKIGRKLEEIYENVI